jgi:hypothetical protein
MRFPKTVQLVVIEDENGITGLAPKGTDTTGGYLAITNGRTLGHDLVEHVNGPQHIGGIQDELEALGAFWYVRLEQGFEQIRNTPDKTLSYDLETVFRDWFNTGAPENLHRLQNTVFEHEQTEAWESSLDFLRRAIPQEFDSYEEQPTPQQISYFCVSALECLAIGYNKARHLYGTQWQAWRLFEAVSECMPKGDFYKGQTFRLTFGYEFGEPFAHCIETEQY